MCEGIGKIQYSIVNKCCTKSVQITLESNQILSLRF